MAPADRVQADNVIPFRRRPAREDIRPTAPRTAAEIMAEAIFSRLGTADLFNYAVQDAVNGVLDELQRHWRDEAEKSVHGPLTAEVIGLRAEIARRDAVDRDRSTLSVLIT